MKYPLLSGEAVSVSSYVRQKVQQLLDERRLVVWYDPERHFQTLAGEFAAVDGSGSVLQARRQADAALQAMNSPDGAKDSTLLLYWPGRRPRTPEELLQDPFAGFAALGVTFGDREGERLESLARQAMPDRVAELETLFQAGPPSLDVLDNLKPGETYPLLQKALGVVSPQEVGVRLLVDARVATELEAVPGSSGELERVLAAGFGFRRTKAAKEGLRKEFGRYVLLSEFRFDLPSPFPPELEHLPTAPPEHREAVYRLCDALRDAATAREAYVDMARGLEEQLRLPALCAHLDRLGTRDTFPFEERVYLSRLQSLAQAGDLAAAREVEQARRASVWRQYLPERGLLWRLAERSLDAFEAMGSAVRPSGGVAARVAGYTRERGGAVVDRCYRLLEQSALDAGDSPELEALVDHCRRRYAELATRDQDAFLAAVVQEGWPPEGLLRQTQVFDRFVEPELRAGRRVALVLADALRFEMGRDLAAHFEGKGSVRVETAAASLPTTTPCGMASLMPGADTTLRLSVDKDGLVPEVGGRRVANSDERMQYLHSRFGDRMWEAPLARLLDDKVDRLRAELQTKDLVVVRSSDLDQMGEKLSSHQARRWMTESLRDLSRAGERLARCGVDRVVFAADHGFVLLSELPAGDTVTLPAGRWTAKWRRSALGSAAGSSDGVLVVDSAKFGIPTSEPNLAVAKGYRAFRGGAAYFHEGLSLQEAVIPVVVFEPEADGDEPGMKPEVDISYRSDSFTSRVIGLKLENRSLVQGELRVRLEVRSVKGKKIGDIAGEAADCDARDPATGVVTLEQGVVTQVPVRLFEDFAGDAIQVQVFEAVEPGTRLAAKQLKNKMLD